MRRHTDRNDVKIAHLLGWYFPDSVGGTEVYVEGLCRRLRAAGHDVLIAAPDARRVAPPSYQHDDVRVFRYPVPAVPTRDEACHGGVVRGAEQLHRWLAVERPDLLHVHSITTGCGLPEIREAVRLGIRVIVTCHLPSFGFMCRNGTLMQWGTEPCDGVVEPGKCAACNLVRLGMPRAPARVVGSVPVGVSRMLDALPGKAGTALGMAASIDANQQMQREMFALAERVVVLNDTGRRMLVSNGSPEHKIVLNRLGISHANLTPKPPVAVHPTVAPVHFAYVGRLHPTKGLVELMRAVRAIPAGVGFLLNVRGPMLDDATRRFAAELGSIAGGDARVVIQPGVAGTEIPALLAGIDALVCPSMWFENGPTIALEAMAAGTPVVASRVGNLAEIIDDGITGRLVAPGDVEGWARALTEIATSPAQTIDRWRVALPPMRTMDDIARDYLTLYAA
ncbi:MAG TPA: glycosyltransferase [Vicinamibacterales bacterium]|nr:glycosyltransferase [Vicinamibacterales bacterium]